MADIGVVATASAGAPLCHRNSSFRRSRRRVLARAALASRLRVCEARLQECERLLSHRRIHTVQSLLRMRSFTLPPHPEGSTPIKLQPREVGPRMEDEQQHSAIPIKHTRSEMADNLVPTELSKGQWQEVVNRALLCSRPRCFFASKHSPPALPRPKGWNWAATAFVPGRSLSSPQVVPYEVEPLRWSTRMLVTDSPTDGHRPDGFPGPDEHGFEETTNSSAFPQQITTLGGAIVDLAWRLFSSCEKRASQPEAATQPRAATQPEAAPQQEAAPQPQTAPPTPERPPVQEYSKLATKRKGGRRRRNVAQARTAAVSDGIRISGERTKEQYMRDKEQYIRKKKAERQEEIRRREDMIIRGLRATTRIEHDRNDIFTDSLARAMCESVLDFD